MMTRMGAKEKLITLKHLNTLIRVNSRKKTMHEIAKNRIKQEENKPQIIKI